MTAHYTHDLPHQIPRLGRRKMHEVRAISYTEKGEVFRILDSESVQRVPTALLQFTGFRDTKRRPVYEGDIVAINGNAPTVVEWQEYRWHPQIPKKTLYEIIGNVWENPELLSKRKAA